MSGCAPDTGDKGNEVANNGEPSSSEVAETLSPRTLSPNPCTKVKLTAPKQHCADTVGVLVVLTGAAECPAEQTPEYQYWTKRFREPNWIPAGGPETYVPGSLAWPMPSGERRCFTVVVRAMGAMEDYQVRANAKCITLRCGDDDVEADGQM